MVTPAQAVLGISFLLGFGAMVLVVVIVIGVVMSLDDGEEE